MKGMEGIGQSFDAQERLADDHDCRRIWQALRDKRRCQRRAHLFAENAKEQRSDGSPSRFLTFLAVTKCVEVTR